MALACNPCHAGRLPCSRVLLFKHAILHWLGLQSLTTCTLPAQLVKHFHFEKAEVGQQHDFVKHTTLLEIAKKTHLAVRARPTVASQPGQPNPGAVSVSSHVRALAPPT